jgi:hypothetical protein
MCRWQRHSVKTFCCECSAIVEQAKTQLRVVELLEEEEEDKFCNDMIRHISRMIYVKTSASWSSTMW